MRNTRIPTWLPAAAVALTFATFVVLDGTSHKERADAILTAWGVLPFHTRFLDADTVMSALRCIRQGVDVFATNPCDMLGRLYDYSPLWLHAAVFPFTPAWIVPVGLAMDALFIAALLLLPAGRSWWQVTVIVVAVLGPPVAFALERANNDLVIFILAMLTASLSLRNRALRLVGLGCAFLAGLLKYYPMLLMAFALRERLRWFIGITLVSVGVFALVVWAEYEPLVRALGLIPSGPYFANLFGARTLGLGLAELFDLPPGWGRVGELACDIVSIVIGAGLALRGWFRFDLARLSAREASFLLAGCLLIVACFSTAQNIGYRAIHLLPTIPAFATLAGGGERRRFWVYHLIIVILLLWADAWQHWIDVAIGHPALWLDEGWSARAWPQIAAWLLREECWWWVVTVMWGILFSAIAQSCTMLDLAARVARPAPRTRSAVGD